jgi:hypothetical protein
MLDSAKLPTAGEISDKPPLLGAPLLVVMATSLAVVLPFFYYGIPSGHDFEFHLNSWIEVLGQWKQGILYPRWAEFAHFGYGEPRFIFYPPASWILGAGMGAILPWMLAPGAYVWLVLTLAGCSMFVLARQWLRRGDAIFAAALYAANPYHLIIVYWRSAFAELLAAAVLPLLFLYVWRLEQGGRRWIAPLALILAAAWLTNAPAAVMANYSLALLAVFWAVAQRSTRILWSSMLAVFLGAGLAAFYIIPATYEQRWVNIFQVLSPGVRPGDNFLFTATDDVVHNQFNQLVSYTALAEMVALAAAAFSWRRWRTTLPGIWWILGAWTLAAALITFSITSPVWAHFPKLRFMQLPWRWLLSFNVGMAFLIAAAWPRRILPRLYVSAALLGTLIFAGYHFQPPWWDYRLDIAEMHENIRTNIGYEGTDEYTPAGADPDQIRREARPVAFEGQGSAEIHMLLWTADTKSFTATASAPGTLVLHLFNFPAWKAEVNGRSTPVGSRPGTGQMMIPVNAGENQVEIRFTRTADRTAGGFCSLAVALILALGFRTKRYEAQIARVR